jgi:uncharacterized protein YeaO (DUF488 family)
MIEAVEQNSVQDQARVRAGRARRRLPGSGRSPVATRRGKEAAAVDVWLKEIAPSAELRKWFAHAPERWAEFKVRYRAELGAPERSAALERLRDLERRTGMVTLLFAARDEAHNHAVELLEVLNERL